MILKDIDYIYAVYQEKSFSKAAQKLFISQPALSASVKKTERLLGVELFYRTTKPLKATPAGEKYIEYVEKVIELRRDMEKSLSAISKTQQLVLNAGGSTYFCSYILPPFLRELQQHYPGLLANLNEGTTTTLKELLEQDKIEFTLDVEIYDTVKFDRYVWQSEELLLAVPASAPINATLGQYGYTFSEIRQGGHLCADAPQIALSKFVNEEFVLLSPGNDVHQRAKNMFKNAGFNANITMLTEQMTTAYNQTKMGYGCSFVRDSIPKNVASTDSVIFYKIADELSRRNVYISTKKNHILSGVAVDFLTNIMKIKLVQPD